jgi:hypothetical protein
MVGLLPIMWGTGSGSEVMSRIAAPMVGGMISSTVLTLAVIPAIYALVEQWCLGSGREFENRDPEMDRGVAALQESRRDHSDPFVIIRSAN